MTKTVRRTIQQLRHNRTYRIASMLNKWSRV